MIDIRISEVIMERTDSRQVVRNAQRQTMASTTLNRKYVQRPTRVTGATSKVAVRTKTQTTPKISHFGSPTVKTTTVKKTEQMQPAKPHPTQVAANKALRERQQQLAAQKQMTKKTAQELKDQAIKKALASAQKTKTTDDNNGEMAKVATKGQKKEGKIHFGVGRVILALTCAAAAVFAIVYFVSLNMPDVQFRATAVQLDATYPNYLPRNFTPIEISSENNITTLKFRNNTNDDCFSITEEKSSWDSNSLLNNYVKEEYGEDYTVVREQGLTIYIGNNKATWVNWGVVYKLNVLKGSLTKKQISAIAVSF